MNQEKYQNLHSLIEASIAEDNKQWREKCEEEKKYRMSKKVLLDNADINSKILDVLRLANSVSDKVAEEIFDKRMSLALRGIKEDLEEITELRAIYEQQVEINTINHEKLKSAQNQLIKMKKKMK